MPMPKTENAAIAATIAHLSLMTRPTRSTLAASSSISLWLGWSRHMMVRRLWSALLSRPACTSELQLLDQCRHELDRCLDVRFADVVGRIGRPVPVRDAPVDIEGHDGHRVVPARQRGRRVGRKTAILAALHRKVRLTHGAPCL